MAREEQAVLDERAHRYRGSRPAPDLRGRTVVIVDDGIATGATARAACAVARGAGAARVVLAAPVAPPGWTRPFSGLADETLALDTPPDFMGVGQFYEVFDQTSDQEVLACLSAP
ncbi:phosphoribosyltransferase family protein [Streptacidiphilus monticola]